MIQGSREALEILMKSLALCVVCSCTDTFRVKACLFIRQGILTILSKSNKNKADSQFNNLSRSYFLCFMMNEYIFLYVFFHKPLSFNLVENASGTGLVCVALKIMEYRKKLVWRHKE